MILPIRDQCEDDYTLQTSLNFLQVLIQTFYTFIIYIVRKSALETQWYRGTPQSARDAGGNGEYQWHHDREKK